MENKRITLFGAIGIISGIALTTYGYFFEAAAFLFIGVGLIILSVFFIMIMQSIALFVNDKKLDINALRKQGLTIVTCPYCEKENVLEDKFCIYCGERLGEDNE